MRRCSQDPEQNREGTKTSRLFTEQGTHVRCSQGPPRLGYVWKLSTRSVTSPKGGAGYDGDETFLESHVLSILPLSTFWDTHNTLSAVGDVLKGNHFSSSYFDKQKGKQY